MIQWRPSPVQLGTIEDFIHMPAESIMDEELNYQEREMEQEPQPGPEREPELWDQPRPHRYDESGLFWQVREMCETIITRSIHDTVEAVTSAIITGVKMNAPTISFDQGPLIGSLMDTNTNLGLLATNIKGQTESYVNQEKPLTRAIDSLTASVEGFRKETTTLSESVEKHSNLVSIVGPKFMGEFAVLSWGCSLTFQRSQGEQRGSLCKPRCSECVLQSGDRETQRHSRRWQEKWRSAQPSEEDFESFTGQIDLCSPGQIRAHCANQAVESYAGRSNQTGVWGATQDGPPVSNQSHWKCHHRPRICSDPSVNSCESPKTEERTQARAPSSPLDDNCTQEGGVRQRQRCEACSIHEPYTTGFYRNDEHNS